MSFSRAKADLAGSRFSDLRWVAETDSTNDDVQAAMVAADPEASREVVVIADHQRSGRGRLGRSWEAPAGASLLMTVGTTQEVPVELRGLLLTAMSVAALEAASVTTGEPLRIKWPNDLVVGSSGAEPALTSRLADPAEPASSKKVAGVLAESFELPDGLMAYAVGIGINCNWGSMPESLRSIAESLDNLTGVPVDREALAVATVLGFQARLDLLASDSAALVAEAKALSATIGHQIVARTETTEVTGVAVDLDYDGALLVDDGSGQPQRVVVGDVVNLRPV